MNLILLASAAGGIFAIGLALASLSRRAHRLANWAFAFGLLSLAAESVLIGFCGTRITEPEQVADWQRWRLMTAAFLPGTWLLFSLSYSRGNYREFLHRWRVALAVVFVLPLVLVFGFHRELVYAVTDPLPPYTTLLRLGWSGFLLNLIVLLVSIVILMNLERTFRSSVGTMRWRIKFMIMGVGLLFAVRIYTSSQFLLYSAINIPIQGLNVMALLLACGMITAAYRRAGLFQVDLYPSHRVLHSSLTVMLAGIYLLVIGVLAKIVMYLGGDVSFPLKALFVLVAIIILTLLLLSERIREHTRRFVSRNFQRPHYDHRRVWSTFTERTASLVQRAELCRAIAQWTADTFHALSVTLWVVDDVSEQLVFGASTVLVERQALQLLPQQAEYTELTQSLRAQPYPVDLEDAREKWVDTLKAANPDVFGKVKGGHRICVPLVAKGELMGLMVLGDRVNGVPFSVEDLDLLKCIGDQAAGNLLSLKLSQKLLQAKEMEAFQTMSAFFVHDLKNTASTLSLMLQNLPAHFADPAFREDALRGLGKSVTRINELIERLGALRQEMALKLAETDLNAVVLAAVRNLEGLKPGLFSKSLGTLPKLRVDAEAMQKVLANLLGNALDALGEGGKIQVTTSRLDNWAALSVSDNGSGMTPEFVARSLFRPFRTTKKKGIGIGMFLSKMIVEAHRGKIEVETQPGKGTTFRVLLPLNGELK